MERLGIVLAAVFTLTCLSVVESGDMDIGHMITWMDPKVRWMIGALKFKNYGCYCNKDGDTNKWQPVDEIDRCCQIHNTCYETLTTVCGDNTGQSYNFKTTTENGAKTILCKNDPHSETCKYELCRCDAAVAECFAKNEPHYNSHHKGYKNCQRVTE